MLVCHVSAAAKACESAQTLETAPAVYDLLVYGQGAGGHPPPPAGELITPPMLIRSASGLLRAAGWLWMIRRRRYALVAIAQPDLSHSRARGVFLALPVIFSAARGVRLDPDGARPPTTIDRSQGILDLVRWAVLQIACGVLAAVVVPIIELVLRRPVADPLPIPAAGTVTYLRTDVDIVANGLRAGGSASHTEGIVGALGAAGYEVDLWSTGEIAGLPHFRRLPINMRANVPIEMIELAATIRQLRAVLRGPAIDGFVYQRYSLNNLTGLLAARRSRVPLVLEVNASEVHWRRQWSRLRFGRLGAATERLLLAHSDRIVTVSGNAAAELLVMGADKDRLRVVPNGVVIERFARAPPRALPFAPGSFVVCFCGLFYPWHGVPVLARAFAELLREVPEARLLLVGDGSERAQVESLLVSSGALDYAYMTGMVEREDVPGYMQAADALVSPHAGVPGFIGSPIKIFEYMAAGRAIVATRVAQLGEILEHERTALLVAPDDPIQLAAALRRLALEPDLRRGLGAAAQREAREHHSWEVSLRQTLGED